MKALDDLIVVLLPDKCSFINFSILETLKARPNIPSSFRFLEQRVYEVVGVHCPLPPQTTLLGAKSLDQEVLTLNRSGFFQIGMARGGQIMPLLSNSV